MIKINLLPQEPHKNVFRFDFFLFLFITALTIAILGAVFFNNEQEIGRERDTIANMKKEIANLDRFYQEYMAVEKEKKEIQRRIQAIEALKKGRALAARTLYDLTDVVKDSLWLRNFRKNDNAFEFEGRALEAESISRLMESLSKIPYIKNVELKTVENVTDEGVEVKKFIIQGNIGI
jgi:Tfp pilus assembly protein PilN